MPEEKVSAEKDLLKLIENPSEAAIKQHPSAPSVAASVSQTASASAGRSRPAFKFQVPDLKKIFTDRKSIIRLLVGLTALLFIYFIFTIVHEYTFLEKAKNIKNFEQMKNARRGASDKQAEMGLGLVESSGSSDDFSLRNVFKPFQKKVEEKKADDISTKLADYKLVGISIEPDPKDSYAMIENTKSSITFFVKKGENFAGLELVDILDEKLVFKSQGQTIEFR